MDDPSLFRADGGEFQAVGAISGLAGLILFSFDKYSVCLPLDILTARILAKYTISKLEV